MIILAQVLALGLGAEPSLFLEAAVRDELRTGTAVALGGGTGNTGLEDVVSPQVRGDWRIRESRFSLGYDPELLVPDLGYGDHVQVLHRGLVEYDWTSHSHVAALVLHQDGQYGIVDIFSLTPPSGSNPGGTGLPQLAPTQPLQPIPIVVGIDYEASNSLVDFRWGASRRVTIDVGGGYRLNGGATAAAQVALPLEQGPFATASLAYTASRRDLLTSRISATDLNFSDGPSDVLLEANQEASRRLAKYLLGSLNLGVGAVRFQAEAAAPAIVDVYPEAGVSLVESLPLTPERTLSAAASATLAPLVDRLGGTVFETLQLLGRLEWTTAVGVSLRAQAGFNEPLYGNLAAAQQLELAQGAIAYQPVRFLRLEVGGVGTWQQPTSGAPATTQWLAFGALVLQETVQK